MQLAIHNQQKETAQSAKWTAPSNTNNATQHSPWSDGVKPMVAPSPAPPGPVTPGAGDQSDGSPGKIVYPGHIVRLYGNESSAEWLAALSEALAKPCEVCGEHMDGEGYLWYDLRRKLGRCPTCQETLWWSDGYDIDECGEPSCWNCQHTREERIAERDQNALETMERWLARQLETPKGEAWLATPEGRQWREKTEPWIARRLAELSKVLGGAPSKLVKETN
jgi:hypothetical protein